MPTVLIDTEQAALIKAAVSMLSAALTARVERADPDQVISNSLTLQANKLSTVMRQLDQPEPPSWHDLGPTMRAKAIGAATMLANPKLADQHAACWEALRGLTIAPGLPRNR